MCQRLFLVVIVMSCPFESDELLAELYVDGLGVPQDHSSAMKLLKEGKRVGSAKAATNLGTLYGQQG